MKIDISMSEGCGPYHPLRVSLDRSVTALKTPVDVVYHTVSYDEAVTKRIKGSPSIWMRGKNAFEGNSSPGIM